MNQPALRPNRRSAHLGAIIAALLLIAGLAPARLAAQVYLTFTGSGVYQVMTMTLTTPVEFTVDGVVGVDQGYPRFMIQGLGAQLGGGYDSVTGDITYSVNGGAPVTINNLENGSNSGDVTTNDWEIANSSTFYSPLSIGSHVVLYSGTFTTNDPQINVAPSDGYYNIYMIGYFNGVPNSIDSTGTPIPEPATTAEVIGSVALLGVVLHRRRVASRQV